MSQAAQIFVSHSHKDEYWCSSFTKSLQQAGGDVWYYPTEDVGKLLMRDIETQLLARPIFVLIMSPDSMRSPWVKREVNAAISLQDRQPERIILPVVAEATEIPPLWAGYKRISGPHDTGLSPDEAAQRVAHALALSHEPRTSLQRAEEHATTYDLVERGAALRARGLYEDALRAYNEALTLDARDAAAWAGKANALQALKRPEDALRAYDEALKLSPDLIPAWTGKAMLLEQLGRSEEARAAYGQEEEAAFDRSLALNFRPALAWYGKGNALRALHHFDEALDAFQRALSLEPHLTPAWVGTGEVLQKLGRVDDAQAAFEQAQIIAAQDDASGTLDVVSQSQEQDTPTAPSASYARRSS